MAAPQLKNLTGKAALPEATADSGGGSSALELLLSRAAVGSTKELDAACAALLGQMLRQASALLPAKDLEVCRFMPLHTVTYRYMLHAVTCQRTAVCAESSHWGGVVVPPPRALRPVLPSLTPRPRCPAQAVISAARATHGARLKDKAPATHAALHAATSLSHGGESQLVPPPPPAAQQQRLRLLLLSVEKLDCGALHSRHTEQKDLKIKALPEAVRMGISLVHQEAKSSLADDATSKMSQDEAKTSLEARKVMARPPP